MILDTPDKIFAEVIARRDAALALYRARGDDNSHGQVVALAGLAHSLNPESEPGDLGNWFDQNLDPDL